MYVHVVMEHHSRGKDARVLGVYADRDLAEAHRQNLMDKSGKIGYVCVLKRKVRGLGFKDLLKTILDFGFKIKCVPDK